MTVLLIDGDILVYSAAFASQTTRYVVSLNMGELTNTFQYIKDAKAFCIEEGMDVSSIETAITVEPWESCRHVVDSMIESYHNAVEGPTTAVIYLTDEDIENNFRYKLDNTYKQNRKDFVKPHWYSKIRRYLQKYYETKVVRGIEADDAMGMDQTNNTIIVSKDKDMLMIPGRHLRMGKVGDDGKPLLYHISDSGTLAIEKDKAGKPRLFGTGFKWFCAQMLTGDNVDNIKGVPRVGPVKAYNLLKDDRRPVNLWNLVKKSYESAKLSPDNNAQLLWILRNDGEFYSEDLVKKIDAKWIEGRDI